MKDIFKKEIARVFGDKKMIFSLFVLPAILMFGIYGLMGMLMNNMMTDVEEHVSIVYVQNAPEGMEALAEQNSYNQYANVTYLAADAEVEQIRDDILNGTTDLLVVFEDEFMEKAENYKEAGDPIPSVKVAYNSTLNYSNAAKSMFDALILDTMETTLLQNRFGNLDLLTVFATEDELIINENKANGEFISSMLPYLIVMLLFAGAMGLVVDAVAGEKERGTMANMLLSPIKRSSIVGGKLFGLSVLSVLSALVYAVSIIIAMPMMMGSLGEASGLGMSISFSPVQILELLGIIITLVLFNVSALFLASSFARNAKEANAYVMPIYMLVIGLGMLTMFNVGGTAPATTTYAIPIYGSSIAIQALVANELTLVQFGMSVGANLICTIVMVVAISKIFNNEKIMLNA